MALRGRIADALREARWLKRWEEDHPELSEDLSVSRVEIFMRLGEIDSAVAVLEPWLRDRPSLVSVHYLRLDPRRDQLTNHPRFRALLTKYGDVGS